MAIVEAFKQRLSLVRFGEDTWGEFFLRYVDRAAYKLLGKRTDFYSKRHGERRAKIREKLKASFRQDGMYRIIDVKLPLLDKEYDNLLFWGTLEDTLTQYMRFNDRYDEEIFDVCALFLSEGAYGLVNDKVSVTVEPGDIVIDAGSWIGDFAAYASVKGAVVYAFEPTRKTFAYLEETARLNGNIVPVNKGLSDKTSSAVLFENVRGNNGNALSDRPASNMVASYSVEAVRLDDFVRENNLERVDFIKADIEGFERNMLEGAQETLRRFAPKLALCTYHLPDDPEVMTSLILKANPKYNIVYKRAKLFASVPD